MWKKQGSDSRATEDLRADLGEKFRVVTGVVADHNTAAHSAFVVEVVREARRSPGNYDQIHAIGTWTQLSTQSGRTELKTCSKAIVQFCYRQWVHLSGTL